VSGAAQGVHDVQPHPTVHGPVPATGEDRTVATATGQRHENSRRVLPPGGGDLNDRDVDPESEFAARVLPDAAADHQQPGPQGRLGEGQGDRTDPQGRAGARRSRLPQVAGRDGQGAFEAVDVGQVLRDRDDRERGAGGRAVPDGEPQRGLGRGGTVETHQHRAVVGKSHADIAPCRRAMAKGTWSRRVSRVKIKVFLLDDHAVVRAGLRAVLEADEDIDVVGEAGTVAEAVEGITLTRPDVAVLDGRLPDGSGVEVCRQVRVVSPETRTIMLTSYDDDEAMLASVLAGASGYLLKEIGTTDIVASVRLVHAGGSLLDPGEVEQVRQRLEDPLAADPRLADLTPQERRVLGLLGEGWTNRQIGAELHLAEKTVKNYVSSLLAKLGLSSRTQAALFTTTRPEKNP